MTAADLKIYRHDVDWSIRQMAAYLDISQAMYRNYEKGTHAIPDKVQARVRKAFMDFKGTMAVGIDYLRISFHDASVDSVISQLMGMSLDDFYEGGGNAKMFMKSSANYGAYNYLRVFGRGNAWHEEGAILQFSGHGVRLFEHELDEQDKTWPEFLNQAINAYGGNVTRIDLAVNDYIGWFDLGQVAAKVENDEYKTEFRSHGKPMGNKYEGRTIYFGSRSNVIMRFYEKDKEVASRLGTSDYEYGLINRYELQLADKDKAAQFVRSWVVNDDMEAQVFGYFKRYVTFYEDATLEKEWQPWHYFLLHAKTIHFETEPAKLDLERTFAWLETSVASSLKLLMKTQGLSAIADLALSAELSLKQSKALQVMMRDMEAENKRVENNIEARGAYATSDMTFA